MLANIAVINGLCRYLLTTDNALTFAAAAYSIFTENELYTDPGYEAPLTLQDVLKTLAFFAMLMLTVISTLSMFANPANAMLYILIVGGFAISGALIGGLIGWATGNDIWDYAAKGALIGYIVGQIVFMVVSAVQAASVAADQASAARITAEAQAAKPTSTAATQATQQSGFNEWLNKGEANNHVYEGISRQTGKAEYTGITKQNLDARLAQHNYAGKDFIRLEAKYPSLTRNQARAVETYLIQNGTANELNQMLSISVNNTYYNDAMIWAKAFMRGF